MTSVSASTAVGPSEDAQAVVKETTDKVLNALRTEGDALRTDKAKLYELINELILPHFDFRQMSQWVLGRYWRQATAEQQDAFVNEFQALLVRTYSGALANYRDQTVSYLPARERSADEVTVAAEIDQGSGPRIPIVYQMHRTDSGWKVYDVQVDGVSLVITYRSSFGQAIKRDGIDGLIQRLAEKNVADRS